ncbi:MAG: COX15/CtaA family protein [Bryobacteraceae bacterium]
MATLALRRFAVLTALCTLLLIVAGALVTSNDASLAISDWPLNWGKLVPPMEGGIRYAFAHRAAAAVVAALVVILAAWQQVREPRAWMRRLGWAVVATVLAQAALGGAVVRFIDPKSLSIAHACLAQICFGLTVAIVVGHFPSLPTAPASASPELAPALAACALFLQTILGAAVRHGAMTPVPHIAGAVVATALAMWAGLQVLMRHMEDAPLRRAATLLLALTFLQVPLGLAAWASLAATAGDPQPMPVMIWATVAHVAVGSLAFGAAISLAMIVSRRDKPTRPDLARGGMAVA